MRISRDQMFMEIAHTVSKRSTCFRGNVGAIVVRDNSIVSIGYNGPPAGEEHCLGNSCPLTEAGGCSRSYHAEENALSRYDQKGISLALYCTHGPCPACARLILAHPVQRVVYATPYRLAEGEQILIRHLVRVERLTPAGYLIDIATGKLVESPQ